MRLIHLTDPHLSNLNGVKFSDLRGKRWSGFVSWHKNRRKKYLPVVLNELCMALKADHADQILLTGDLLQTGLESEIEQATKWLPTLGSPDKVMLVPGNHDIYASGSAAAVYRSWADYLFHGSEPGQFPVVRKLGRLTLIGLSSAVVSPIFMASGKLDLEQLNKLTLILKQASSENQLVCLLIHHPPLPGMTGRRKGLANADALQAVLETFPPALIFHGHLHHNRELLWNDSRVYCTAAASSIADASYRVIDIEEHGESWNLNMILKSIAIDADGSLQFLTVDEQSWQLPKI